MKKITIVSILILFAGGVFLSAQSLNFKIGFFTPKLNSDLWETNKENLYFSKDDMSKVTYSVELEQFMGKFVSLSIEGGYYSNTVNSQYRDYEYDDGEPIYQNLFLSVSGLEANIKVYPLGHRKIFYPYLGVGVGVYHWKYEQWGEFIDFTNFDIYEGSGYTDEYSTGINVKGGFVFRFKRLLGISFEIKSRYLKGKLSSLFEGFEKLDLSGNTINVGINLFFR